MKSLLLFAYCFFVNSLLYGEINVHFIVDENYLIAHTLTTHQFSSDQDRDTIIAFKNDVWVNNEIAYRLLPNSKYLTPELWLHPSLQAIMSLAKSLETFQPVLSQTLSYKDFCENQWNETYLKAKEYVAGVTGINLDEGDFEVYLTHPSQANGFYMGNHKISWGCSGHFDYYDTIYVWHEILHSYLPNDHIAHCLIQFISDNGLRALLNGTDSVLPLESHSPLLPLMQAIYPKWEEYLQRPNRDIFQFLDELNSDPLLKEQEASVQWY